MYDASAVYNLAYRTEDAFGQAPWSFTTLFTPKRPYFVTEDSHGSSPGTRGGNRSDALGTALGVSSHITQPMSIGPSADFCMIHL